LVNLWTPCPPQGGHYPGLIEAIMGTLAGIISYITCHLAIFGGQWSSYNLASDDARSGAPSLTLIAGH